MLCGSRKDDSIGSLNVDAGVDIPRELGLDGLDDIYGMDMNHTVYISGPHHVLSNCQNDLPGLLQWWGGQWIDCRIFANSFLANVTKPECWIHVSLRPIHVHLQQI